MSNQRDYEFRTRLGIEQYDVILTKEQWVLTKIRSSFEGENTPIQYNVLVCDLHFNDYSLQYKLIKMGIATERLLTE